MSFIDIAISPVPEKNKDKYLEMSRVTTEIFKRHGALRVAECWGVDIPEGELTSLPMAVKLEDGEAVAFSIVEWADKAARDTGMQEAFEEMSQTLSDPMPFDGKRMVFGGFESILAK